MLPQNSGVEGWEVAMKLARRWAYSTGRVSGDKAVVLFPEGNFGGRTLGAISASTDPASYAGFGPLLPGIRHVPFGDASAVEAALAADPNIIAFFAEPIQGEAGIVIPPPDYFPRVKAACERAGALLVADEVQTGLGRTGALLASHTTGTRPDIVVLGKALGGGVLPVSAILASHAIMLSIRPGEHGSTFGGNPLANAVAEASLRVVVEEDLSRNARERGVEVRAALSALCGRYPKVLKESRGIGLMNACELHADACDETGAHISARDVCVGLGEAKERFSLPLGLLAKPTHEHTIRLTPPLVITQEEVGLAMDILGEVLERLVKGGGARRGKREGGNGP